MFLYSLSTTAHPVIVLAITEKRIDQGDGVLKVKVLRKMQKKGQIIVPWKLVAENEDSVYTGVKGEISD